jgi:hypothetical protein
MLLLQDAAQLAFGQSFADQLDEATLLSFPVAVSAGGDEVVLPELPVHDLAVLTEKPLTHQAVEPGIEMARAQPIAVVTELFYHPEPVDGLFRRVMKDMELDEIDRESFSIHDNSGG